MGRGGDIVDLIFAKGKERLDGYSFEEKATG
jgi:hypothetical protein